MKDEKTERGPDTAAHKTVGEFVAEDYRTATVFEKHGIDFCCGGNIALSDACREKGIDLEMMRGEIASAKSTPLDREQDYGSWDCSSLADYIVTTHHAYLNENLGHVDASARKVASVHGANHPEVIEIADIFTRIAADLAAHLREEEEVLFPAIKRVEADEKTGAVPDGNDLAAIRRSLEKLIREHEEVGDAIHAIRRLSHDYALPPDACATYMTAYRKLEEFEDDLHKHVHLENNILFPKAARYGS